MLNDAYQLWFGDFGLFGVGTVGKRWCFKLLCPTHVANNSTIAAVRTALEGLEDAQGTEPGHLSGEFSGWWWLHME